MSLQTEPRMDARQRKSRSALYAALDALLAERAYADITVTDLVQRAAVGRQTFYRHFSNIDAMLEQRLGGDLADHLDFARERAAANDPDRWIADLTTYAFERAGQQPRLYRLILSGEAGSGALQSFIEQIGKIVNIAPEGHGPISDEPAIVRYAQSYYAGAISAFMLQWLNSDNDDTPQHMGELFARLSAPGADGVQSPIGVMS